MITFNDYIVSPHDIDERVKNIYSYDVMLRYKNNEKRYFKGQSTNLKELKQYIALLKKSCLELSAIPVIYGIVCIDKECQTTLEEKILYYYEFSNKDLSFAKSELADSLNWAAEKLIALGY